MNATGETRHDNAGLRTEKVNLLQPSHAVGNGENDILSSCGAAVESPPNNTLMEVGLIIESGNYHGVLSERLDAVPIVREPQVEFGRPGFSSIRRFEHGTKFGHKIASLRISKGDVLENFPCSGELETPTERGSGFR